MAEEEVVLGADYFFVEALKKKLEMRPAGWSSADTADYRRETTGTKNSWTHSQKTSTSMASS
jgi:hypothetical protein